MCSTDLIQLARHLCVPGDRIRVQIRLTSKRVIREVGGRADELDPDDCDMTVKCEHNIRVGSLKKLFLRKFVPSPGSVLLNFFSTDSVTLDDDETMADIVLRSGGLDNKTPVLILAELIQDETALNIDDMPVLVAENYPTETISTDTPPTPTAIHTSTDDAPKLYLCISPPELPRVFNSDGQQTLTVKPKVRRKRRMSSHIEPSKPPKQHKTDDSITADNGRLAALVKLLNKRITSKNASLSTNNYNAIETLPVCAQPDMLSIIPTSPVELQQPTGAHELYYMPTYLQQLFLNAAVMSQNAVAMQQMMVTPACAQTLAIIPSLPTQDSRSVSFLVQDPSFAMTLAGQYSSEPPLPQLECDLGVAGFQPPSFATLRSANFAKAQAQVNSDPDVHPQLVVCGEL